MPPMANMRGFEMQLIRSGLINFYDCLVIYIGLVWLGVLCLVWTPIALIVYPILTVRRGRVLGRYVTMVGFRLFLACLTWTRRCSFDVEALDTLRAERSLIIAPNHPCLLDAVMIISRLPNVACVLKADLMNNIFLGAGARLARYVQNEPVRRMVQLAILDIADGSHLLLFPEGTRTTHYPVNPYKGSIGLIAYHAQVSVQTVLIETNSAYLGKGWSLFRKPPMPIHYRVRLGRRFAPPKNARQFTVELEHYFANELIPSATMHANNKMHTQPVSV